MHKSMLRTAIFIALISSCLISNFENVPSARAQSTLILPENVARLTLRNPTPAVGSVQQILWTPDGRLMIVVGNYGYWLFDGKGLPDFNASRTYVTLLKSVDDQFSYQIRYAVISPDSRFIAFSFNSAVGVYELESGAQVNRFAAYINVNGPPAFSPDGNMLVIPVENSIRLWNYREQQRPMIIELETTKAYAAAFSPNGQWLATSGSEHVELRAVRNGIVDREATKRLIKPDGTRKDYSNVLFTPDSQRLIAKTLSGGVVSQWDVESGKLIPLPLATSRQEVSSIAFSMDGKLLAIGQSKAFNTVLVAEAATNKLLLTVSGSTWFGSLAFSPDGRTFAVVFNGWVSFWDLTARDKTETRAYFLVHFPNRKVSVTMDAAGRTLMTSGEYSPLLIWDTDTMHYATGNISADEAELSPDGTLLATVSSLAPDTVILYDTAKYRIKQRLTHTANALAGMRFSADSRFLFTMDAVGVLRKWDMRTGQTTPIRLTPKAGQLYRIIFSPDSRLFGFVTTSYNQPSISHIYDTNTGEQTLSLTGTSLLLFSPDNRLLVTTSGATNEIRNAATGALLYSLKQGDGPMPPEIAAAFSPDSRLLALAYRDGSIVFRDASTGTILHTANETGSQAAVITFSPEGNQFISVDIGGIVRFWRIANP